MHRLYFIIAFCVSLIACRGEEPKRMPDTLPDLNGRIVSVNQANTDGKEATAQLLVKANEDQSQGYAEASIRVNKNTLIEDKDGKYLKTRHLQEGQQVQVWFDGDVMESMPVQATAKAILVMPQP